MLRVASFIPPMVEKLKRLFSALFTITPFIYTSLYFWSKARYLKRIGLNR